MFELTQRNNSVAEETNVQHLPWLLISKTREATEHGSTT